MRLGGIPKSVGELQQVQRLFHPKEASGNHEPMAFLGTAFGFRSEKGEAFALARSGSATK